MSNSLIEVVYDDGRHASVVRWLDEHSGRLYYDREGTFRANGGFQQVSPRGGLRRWGNGHVYVRAVVRGAETPTPQRKTAAEVFADAAAPGASLETRKNGKVRMDLVVEGFPFLFHELGRMMTWAAVVKGYKPHDWKGYDETTFLAAAERHRNKRLRGEAVDEESGLDHRVHEAFNLMAAAEVVLMKEQKK